MHFPLVGNQAVASSCRPHIYCWCSLSSWNLYIYTAKRALQQLDANKEPNLLDHAQFQLCEYDSRRSIICQMILKYPLWQLCVLFNTFPQNLCTVTIVPQEEFLPKSYKGWQSQSFFAVTRTFLDFYVQLQSQQPHVLMWAFLYNACNVIHLRKLMQQMVNSSCVCPTLAKTELKLFIKPPKGIVLFKMMLLVTLFLITCSIASSLYKSKHDAGSGTCFLLIM